METNTLITIILGIAFVGACIIGSVMESDNLQLRSDLCYSLKTNRILMEGFIDVTGDTPEIQRLNKSLIKMEKDNWMECTK